MYSPSLLSRGSENGSCSLFAIWAAVPGISCISPRAPTELWASVENALSCRTMARISGRSAVPPAPGTVVIG